MIKSAVWGKQMHRGKTGVWKLEVGLGRWDCRQKSLRHEELN